MFANAAQNPGSIVDIFQGMDNIWDDVMIERLRQEALRSSGKFKATCATLGEHQMNDHQCLAVLGEEFGEVARAINENDSKIHLREELVQVAAVCVAWIERIDR